MYKKFFPGFLPTVANLGIVLIFFLSASFPEKTIAANWNNDDVTCLAFNIYYEARNEDKLGRIGVGQVVLRRVDSTEFPNSICGVVTQGGETLHKCQFSWWCDGKPDTPYEKDSWVQSVKDARIVLAGTYPDVTKGALYYYSTIIPEPKWFREALTRTETIGSHRFYK